MYGFIRFVILLARGVIRARKKHPMGGKSVICIDFDSIEKDALNTVRSINDGLENNNVIAVDMTLMEEVLEVSEAGHSGDSDAMLCELVDVAVVACRNYMALYRRGK